jgi:hypothetical protein
VSYCPGKADGITDEPVPKMRAGIHFGTGSDISKQTGITGVLISIYYIIYWQYRDCVCQGGIMRKLVFILIAFIAAVTFIRAFDKRDNTDPALSRDLSTEAINLDL